MDFDDMPGAVSEAGRVLDGLTITFRGWCYPLGDYSRALEAAGFVIERIREPAVPDAAIDHERTRRWQRIPLFLHLRAVRP